jgi:hypothetical protein
LFHRQADYVRVRAVDPRNDFRAIPLSRVGARFVHWIDFCEISSNLPIVKRMKCDLRAFATKFDSSGPEMRDKHSRKNLMHAIAQTTKDFYGMSKV